MAANRESQQVIHPGAQDPSGFPNRRRKCPQTVKPEPPRSCKSRLVAYALGLPADMFIQHLSDDAPPAYGSPAPSFGSPGPEAVTPLTRSVKPESDSKGQAAMGAGSSSAVNAGSSSDGELRTQLADANATISRLKQQAEEQGLRQRKSDAVNQDARERITTGTTGMGVQQQPADGVPVQIVAALCLLSFLLAYFFF